MAGDWIKMRTDIYRDPKVCVISDILIDGESELAGYVNQLTQRAMTVTRNVTRCATVGALVTVWGVMRHRGTRVGDDLSVTGVTPGIIDDIADMPGFGAAMVHVGWVLPSENGIVFPNFFAEYNAEPTHLPKTKAAERQAKYRRNKSVTTAVTRDVTHTVTQAQRVTSQSNARIEKNREENNTPAGRKIGEKPSTLDEKAADLATEFHFHFQGRKPVLDDLRTGFREKLRHYGEDRFDAILEAIKGDRDKTQYFLGFWIWLEKTNPPTPTIKPYEIVKTKDQLKYEATLERLRLQEEAKKNAS